MLEEIEIVVSDDQDGSIETSVVEFPDWLKQDRSKATLYTFDMKEPLRGYVIRAANKPGLWMFEYRIGTSRRTGLLELPDDVSLMELIDTCQLMEKHRNNDTIEQEREIFRKKTALEALSPRTYKRLQNRRHKIDVRKHMCYDITTTSLDQAVSCERASELPIISPSSIDTKETISNEYYCNIISPSSVTCTNVNTIVSPCTNDEDSFTEFNFNRFSFSSSTVEKTNDPEYVSEDDLSRQLCIPVRTINFYFNAIVNMLDKVKGESRRDAIRLKVGEKLLGIKACDGKIIENIKTFLNERKGKVTLLSQHAKDAIWCAMSGDNITPYQITRRMAFKTEASAVRGFFLRRSRFHFDKLRRYKARKDSVRQLANEAVYNFLHDSDVTKVDSNGRGTVRVRNPTNNYIHEPHAKRFLHELADIHDTYSSFLASIHYSTFVDRVIKSQQGSSFNLTTNLPTIGRERFRSAWCKCVGPPTVASCIDIIEDKLRSCCDALEMYFYKTYFKHQKVVPTEVLVEATLDDEISLHDQAVDCCLFTQLSPENSFDSLSLNANDEDTTVNEIAPSQLQPLESSKWSSIFKRRSNGLGTIKNIVQLCLCDAKAREDLTIPGASHPFFMSDWKCYNLTCPDCGIGNALDVNDLFLTGNEDIIELMVWEDMPRAGGRSQLENVARLFPVKEVFARLLQHLQEYLPHLGRKLWLTQTRNLDIYRLKSNELLICTDFSAQVDLRPIKTTTCYVDQHLVLGIFFVFHNRRNVSLRTGDSVSVLDCDVFHCVGDLMEKEIRNDHDFHLSCIDYIVKEYQCIYDNGLEVMKIHTDNCASQYKGRKNFFNVAILKDEWGLTVEHRFAEVHCFKGPWDGQGKIAKQHLAHCQKKQVNVTCAKEACDVLNKYFKDEMAEDTPWDELERAGDEKLKAKTPYSIRFRRALYVTENEDLYKSIIAGGDKNVVLANRFRSDEHDCSALDGTASSYHFVASNPVTNGIVKMQLRGMPCSCEYCIRSVREGTIGSCPYRHITGEWTYYDRKSLSQVAKDKEERMEQDLFDNLYSVREAINFITSKREAAGTLPVKFDDFNTDVLKKMIKVCNAPRPVRLDGARGRDGKEKEPLKSDLIVSITQKYDSVLSVLQFIQERIRMLPG